MLTTKERGDIAESKARDYLVKNGYKILDQNHFSRFGEIDIIASKDETLHFVEVKSGLSYESAVFNLTPSKINKIVKTIYTFMKKHSIDQDFVLDAIIVTKDEIEMIENLTL